MKLEDAIRRLRDRVAGDFSDNDPENVDDLRLGMEALKRIKAGRNPERRYVCHLLPGETA